MRAFRLSKAKRDGLVFDSLSGETVELKVKKGSEILEIEYEGKNVTCRTKGGFHYVLLICGENLLTLRKLLNS